jgi:hypothetical protein
MIVTGGEAAVHNGQLLASYVLNHANYEGKPYFRECWDIESWRVQASHGGATTSPGDAVANARDAPTRTTTTRAFEADIEDNDAPLRREVMSSLLDSRHIGSNNNNKIYCLYS